MPVEGPLRDFGVHDVFQLLDISRKTGMLRVTAPVRDDEAHVYFEGGKVISANLKSQPGIAAGAEDVVRQRIETVVFDLLGWREGFFSFEERPIEDLPPDARSIIATESLLMESARRIDEWSRIADKVPNLQVVPALAPAEHDHETQLDLLPHEWEVLTLIDGARDVKAIASELRRDEFEVAKVVYGLATTGVVEMRPRRLSTSIPAPAAPVENPAIGKSRAQVATDLRSARASLERFLQVAPNHAEAPRVRAALDSVVSLLAVLEPGRV